MSCILDDYIDFLNLGFRILVMGFLRSFWIDE